MRNIFEVKIRTVMKKDPKPETTTISLKILESTTTGLYHYFATDLKYLDDNNCHKSRTKQDESTGLAYLCEDGPAIPIPEKQTRSINIHAYYTESNANSIENIKLYR